MACLIDQELTFVDGEAEVSVADIDYSNYILTLGENSLSFAGKDEDLSIFLAGGTLDSPVYPTVTVFPGVRLRAFAAQGETYEGTAYVTLCEKGSDSDSCPDTPLSESIPEKYADYIDDNGNFVPKASSGGGGDCPFDIINVSVIDETEDVYVGDAVKIAHLISEPFSGIVSALSGGNEELQAIAYNGKALLFADSNSVTITINPISNAQPAGSPGYLYITGDVSITIKDKGGAA